MGFVVIRALGRDAGGKVVAEHTLQTAGEAKQLRLEIDRPRIQADGQDLVHVRVWVVDEKGTLVPNASDVIRFELTGPARLAGACNGSNRTDVVYSADEVNAWRGSALAVIRSTREGGTVRLNVTADGLTDAVARIEVAAD